MRLWLRQRFILFHFYPLDTPLRAEVEPIRHHETLIIFVATVWSYTVLQSLVHHRVPRSTLPLRPRARTSARLHVPRILNLGTVRHGTVRVRDVHAGINVERANLSWNPVADPACELNGVL